MGTKKSISFTVTNDLNYDQRMRRICSSLSKAGYDVELIGRVLPNSEPTSTQPFKQTRLKCWFHNGKLFYLEYNLRLLVKLLSSRQNIISSIDCDTLWACALASCFKGKPLVFDAHELFSEVPEVARRPLIQKVWRLTEKLLIPTVQLAYTVCDSISAYYTGLHKVQFETIRNMPKQSKDQSYENPLPYSNYVLYQGALNEGRGLEQLLDAMQQVDEKLVLVGDGDIKLKLEEQTKRLNLQKKVHFTGYVSPQELPAYTAYAKVGINVSQNVGLSYYLSLNNKFFDYVQAGLPAVTNKFPEYVQLNQTYEVIHLVDGNHDSIAEGINLLLNDQAYYQKLKENCFIAAKEFIWEKEEQKLIQLYDNL